MMKFLNAAANNSVADSTRKYNSIDRNGGQAAVASWPFVPSRMRSTDENLHAAYPRATTPKIRSDETEHNQTEIAAIIRDVRRSRVSIDERRAILERRAHLGDWDLDTVIGKDHKQTLLSLTERKSWLTLLAKVPTRVPSSSNRRFSSCWIHLLTTPTP